MLALNVPLSRRDCVEEEQRLAPSARGETAVAEAEVIMEAEVII